MLEDLSSARLQDLRLEGGFSQALVIRAFAPPKAADRRREVSMVLRTLLGGLTGQAPESLRLGKTADGKPILGGASGLAFNLSHSRGYSLIAISSAGDIGCDIEDRFTGEDVTGLCVPVLHASEMASMARLAPHERRDAFRRYWVRKEAVLKAAGSGFLCDPRQVVTGLDERSPTWVAHDGPALVIHDIQVDGGCVAAIASKDAACKWRLLAG
jgi:phosphopantetheinyl transferase